MPTATTFLATRGGRLCDGIIADFGDYPGECDAFAQASCLADASDLGLLRIQGADATVFLHNQLSTNVKALQPGQGQYSTYNSPKGRMLATIFLWRVDDDGAYPVYCALVAADLVAVLKKRLGMFILRSKVTIDDLSPDTACLALCGTTATAVIQNLLQMSAPLPLRHAAARDGLTAIALSPSRTVLLVPADALATQWPALAALHDPAGRLVRPAGRHLWRRAAIFEGVPLITAATADRLIPQSANADALGALDFQKGCYPGQEVVARTHYLGRAKERLYLARCDAPFDSAVAAGTPLYSPVFGEQGCGIVVNIAPDRQGTVMLVSAQTTAADSALHLGTPEGPVLTMLPLPYDLPVAETPTRPKL